MNAKSIAVLAVAMAVVMAAMSFSMPSDATGEPEYDTDLGTMYGYTMQFVFTGSDASSVTWDFGDGSEPVTAWNPQHTYEEVGVYYVTQDAYNTYNGGSHSIAVYKITIAGYPWIDFESNGGSAVDRIQMESAGQNAVAAQEPDEPTKSGYEFTGWFVDEDCTQPYDWSSLVTEAITLYAGWEEADESTEPTDPSDPNEPETPDEPLETFPYWILVMLVTAIFGIATFATRNVVLAIVTIVAGIVTVLLYIGVI